MEISPVMQTYILHWGEMGSRWGVSRSVAQIHALLYLAATPLTADQIGEALVLARSNVSTSLRELQHRGLVRVGQVIGDRRDYFSVQGDTWSMLMAILEDRKRRELEPTLQMLQQCVLEMDGDPDLPAPARDNIVAMLKLTDSLNQWVEQMKSLPQKNLLALIDLGPKVTKVLSGKKKKNK